MSIWSKTGNSAWSKINSLFIKTGSVTWTELLGAWVKTGSTTWTKVFTRFLVPANTVAPAVTGSEYLYGTLTGTLGSWTSPNGANSYSRQWQSAANNSGSAGSYGNISGATSSTYTTTINENGRWVRLRVTATNLSGDSVAFSNEVLITKYSPVSLLPYTLSGTPTVGGTLTAQEQIGSWKSTTTNTDDTYPDTFEYEWSWSDGTIRQSTAYNSVNSSSYLIVNADLNNTIRVRVTGTNSAILDSPNRGAGSATSNYTTSGTITSQYSFAFGNTLYVGSNGYITLDQAPSSAVAALPAGNGRTLNIWNEDLVQYRLQEYSDSSNYHLYFRAYRYQSPLVQSAINALDYQIKFYTSQPYCDVYLFRKGSSVPAYINNPGYYSNGLFGTSGFSGTFTAGSVLRIYFNGTTPANTSVASWTSISNSLWKDITTTQIDDSFTSVVTSANQSFSFTSPTPSSVTYSGGVFTINFTGGSGPFYQGWYQTDSGAIGTQPALTGTVDSTPDAPQSGGSFTSSPLTRTLTGTPGYTYYWWVRSATSATITGAGEVTSWSGPVSVTIPNATMTTAPTYGSATSTSDGFTASINNTPDPSGGTYAVVSNSNANASTSITSGGAVTVTGLAASASNTVTVSYAKFGFTTVQFTVTGTASAANTAPGAVRNLSYSLITVGARITWDTPSSNGGSAITKYQIRRDSASFFDNSPLTSTTYDYTLSPNTYTVYVRAVNAIGNGPESSVSVTIPTPTPVVSSCNVITGGRSGSSPNFTWPNPKALFTFTCSNASSADVQIQYSQFGTTWLDANAVQNVVVSSNQASIQTNQPGTNIGNYYYRATCKPYSGSNGSGTAGTQVITASVQNTQTAKNQAIGIS